MKVFGDDIDNARPPRRTVPFGRTCLPWVFAVLIMVGAGCGRNPDIIVVGSKNFTESIILGEMLAQHLERHGLTVERKLNLAGSFIAHQAMIADQMDMYVEYTGTAYSAILELPSERDPATVRHVVDSIYQDRWQILWTEALGFNNTFAMLVRAETAANLGITTLSEAVPHAFQWRAGFGYEFTGRPDGLPGLRDWYGLAFSGEPTAMDLSLTYRALSEGTVDLIAGNSTDGQIEALNLFHLADDRGFFPPYEAVPVVRMETLERHPSIREALRELGGALSEESMRHMNYLVDAEGWEISQVVSDFLDGLSTTP